MKKLNELVIAKIGQLGLSGILSSKERAVHIQQMNRLLLIFWALTIVVPLLPKLLLIFFWLIIVILTFVIIEPLGFCITKLTISKLNFTRMVDLFRSVFLRRKFHEQINIISFVFYCCVCFGVMIAFFSNELSKYFDWKAGLICIHFLTIYIYVLANANNKEDPDTTLLSTYDAFLNVWAGVKRAFENISRVIQQITISLVIGLSFAAFSQDLWIFVATLNWVAFLILAICVLLVFGIAARSMNNIIDVELENYQINYDLCSAISLRHSLARFSDIKDFGNLSQLKNQNFIEYDDFIATKWKPVLLNRAIKGISSIVKTRMPWQLFLESLIFFIFIFSLTFLLSITLFPNELLKKWIDVENVTIIFAMNQAFDLLGWINHLVIELAQNPNAGFDDPTLKYSIIVSLLLSAQYILTSSHDVDKLKNDLGLYLRQSVSDCISLAVGYFAYAEDGYQIVGNWGTTFRISGRLSKNISAGRLYFDMPIIVVSNSATNLVISSLVSKLLREIKKPFDEYFCFLYVCENAFYQSFLPYRCGVKFTQDSLKPIPINNLDSNCWVWMGAKQKKPGLNNFTNFYDAMRFLEERVANDVLE